MGALLIEIEVGVEPLQENKSPKNREFSEGKTSGLGGFNFWNYLRQNNAQKIA
jgi:hypothetical protein